MTSRHLLSAALALVLAAPAYAQAPPTPQPVPAPTGDKTADPVNPTKAEQEPRSAAQEMQKQASQGGPATPGAAEAKKDEPPKWDVSAPPGPSRQVPIDVTSGTWMSLDVSPDGREIVFDLLGDLYVMPIGGGEARALSTGVAWDMQPRYSPNGRWIAFTSDRGGGDNIWIVDRDGSNPRQVTKETFRLLNSPDWTPDSEFIVARKHFTSTRSLGAGEMWLYHRSGGEGLQLTKKRTEQKDTGEPAFSPDGRYLYFSDDATPGGIFEYSKDVNGQIYVIQRLDREKGEVEPFVTGPGGSIRPTPSPDGKSLAFIRRVRYKSVLYVMDLASGRETPVFDGLDRDTGADLGHAIHDHALARLQPAIDHPRFIGPFADLDRTDLGLVFLADHKHELALRALQHGALRHHDGIHALRTLEQGAHELARPQHALRIGQLGTRLAGAGFGIHADVRKTEFALLVVQAAIRQLEHHIELPALGQPQAAGIGRAVEA